MTRLKFVLASLALTSLVACSTLSDIVGELDEVADPPEVKVKPELDYSGETPDCKTAGKRLAENIEVGMALDEVIRLVGKPSFRLPGSWWWSAKFSEAGVPVVKFQFGAGVGTKPVNSFVSDIDKCPE